MSTRQNEAKTLTEKIWGSDFIASIPPMWRSTLKYVRLKTPGVPNGTEPAEITGGLGGVVSSQVTTNRINELEKETTSLDTELDLTKIAHGQRRNTIFGIPIPFTKQMTLDGDGIGDPLAEINPFNPFLAETERVDLSALTAFLETYYLKYTSEINIDLPDRLVSVTALIEKSVGEGLSEETGTAVLTGTGSVSLGLRATAQSSASIIPKVKALVQPFAGNNIAATHLHFFLLAPVDDAQVTARIEDLMDDTVDPWPLYNPQIEEFVAIGGKRSIQVSASSQGSVAVGSGGGRSSSAAGGTGYSEEAGLLVEITRTSPVIHGIINVGGTTGDSQDLSAQASAEASGVGPAKSVTRNGTASGSVSPTTLAATLGDTDWPTDGLFRYRTTPEPFIENFVQYHVVVVNADDFPNNV